jgi:Fe-S oxidoreductase
MMGLLDKVLGGNILFYPGCMQKFVLHDLQDNYEKILRKCGIDFIKLKDLEACCGSPVINAGYSVDFEALAKKNYKIFKEHGVKKIISPCPACFKTFGKEYPKIIEGFDIEVEHVTQTIWNAIKEEKIKVKKLKKPVKVTYHDPCHLGRHCGIYDEPREIIRALGYNLVEMKSTREDAFCCGGGGGLRSNYPELAEEVAKERIDQAKEIRVKIIATTCAMCKSNLNVKNKSKIETVELSSLLVDRI